MVNLPGTHSAFSEIFANLEEAIVSGHHQKCRELLNSMSPKTLPREWAVQFAALANRIHYSLYALKALHRFINPVKPNAPKASDQEKTTYAYALCILGATDEALEIFDSINRAALPEASFLKAITYFRKWNYSQSIPLLKEFLRAPSVEIYRRHVGEVNLIAALVATDQWDQALVHLDKIQLSCEKEKYNLLLGNCLELRAQVYFFKKQYDTALTCLEQARVLLSQQQGLYLLFVEKWTLICHLFKNPNSENLAKLQNLSHKAQELEDFETVRECELFEAIATDNAELLKKVIMGTPSENYRQRARQLFGKSIKPVGQYEWDLNLRHKGTPRVFNPYEKQQGRSALYEKPNLLLLFEALTVDFYKPRNLGALFKSVYPNEKFNPFTSPARVMQLLKRLDKWLQTNHVPIRVYFKKSQFKLTASEPIQIIIQRGKKLSATDGRWIEIRNIFEGRTFSTAKISETIGISKTSTQRLIKQALAEGRIQPIGRGPGTSYKFKSRKKSKLAA